MRLDTKVLQTVNNFARAHDVTASYIYKLVKEGKMNLTIIDGIRFVDTTRYSAIPVVNRRK